MAETPLFYLIDPSEVHQQSPSDQRLGTVRPSALLAVPKILVHALAAAVVTYFSPIFKNEIGWVAQQIANFMGNAFPYNTWYGWYLVIVWIGIMAPAMWRVLALRTTKFEFTTQLIFYSRGIFNRKRDQLEISRIRDLSTERPFWQRLMGLGCLIMETVDRSHPMLPIQGQPKVDDLKDWLHQLNILERGRIGYREFEGTN